ncbi:MAG: serine hydrolase [Nitrospiraceae bacterium]|nr:serine hydrolase [Nitrospiraceae bacterium]
MKHLLMLLAMTISFNSASQSVGNGVMPNYKHVSKLMEELTPSDGPGIQYIIVDKDSVIFQCSSGLSDIQNRTPLRMNHTMAAFSMTKTITAIAILQLVERGIINLDDKVNRYIEHPYNPDITIRHLLNHTSGIPNPIPLKWVHLANNDDKFNEGAALAHVLRENPKSNNVPGENYAYSNIGYWLLGKVIEAVTEQQYQAYVKQNIFKPLKLGPAEIDFKINDPSHHAKGYLAKYSFMNFFKSFVTNSEVWGEYEGSWLHIENVYLNGPSFGGVIGSAKAFSRILQDLLSDESILIRENTKQLLYESEKTNSDKPIPMTLGWHVGDLNGLRYFYKEGGGAGFHSEMRIYPSVGFASVIMTNRTSFNSRKELSRIDVNFIM